jgi:YfiH family protein
MKVRATRATALDAVAGLVHGFEQRSNGNHEEPRRATRERVREALAARGTLHLLEQVHGRDVVVAPWEGTPTADGGVVAEPGVLVGIETADCLPVLLVDPARRVAAGTHAGWRGTVAGVNTSALDAMAARGTRADDVVAALGPCIGVCCYEVGAEVERAFGDAFGADAAAGFFRPGPRGRAHLDLRAANRHALRVLGVRDENIHDVADCTRCRADLYFSYRRDGAGAGRMISWVGFARP